LVLDATNIPTDLTDFTSRRKSYHELQNRYGNSSVEKFQNSCHGLEPAHSAYNLSFCKLNCLSFMAVYYFILAEVHFYSKLPDRKNNKYRQKLNYPYMLLGQIQNLKLPNFLGLKSKKQSCDSNIYKNYLE
jgi:hypothetical protein